MDSNETSILIFTKFDMINQVVRLTVFHTFHVHQEISEKCDIMRSILINLIFANLKLHQGIQS